MATLFDRIGGDELRRVIADFYDRVFDDMMIGFMFRGRDKARLVEKEWELAAELLGGDVAYRGRPIRDVHAKLPIMGGHFERRLKILEDVLREHAVDDQVREAWIRHTRELRPLVTTDRGSECDATTAASRQSSTPDEREES